MHRALTRNSETVHYQVYDSYAGFRFDLLSAFAATTAGDSDRRLWCCPDALPNGSRVWKSNLSLVWFPTPSMVRGARPTCVPDRTGQRTPKTSGRAVRRASHHPTGG